MVVMSAPELSAVSHQPSAVHCADTLTPQRSLQCLPKPAHDLVDFLLRDNERRRDHHEVAIRPIGVPHVGPHHQSRLLCRLGERLGEVRRARERRAGFFVLDELDPGEQAAAAHVAHVRQLPQRREPLLQHLADAGAPLDQVVALEIAHGGEARGARHAMVGERLRMHEVAGAVGDHVDDALGCRHGGERRVPPRDSLAECHDVGQRPVRLDRPPGAGAPGAAQDLVRDQEHLVAVADLPDSPEVLGAGSGGTGGGAAHRLGDERRHAVGTERDDRGFQRDAAAHRASGVVAATRAAVGIRRSDAMHVHQPLPEHRLVVLARRRGEREQRVAVIGRSERDDLVLLRPAALHPVLPRQLERGFHRLGAAREEIQLVEVAGERRGELGSELLHRCVREGGGRQIAELPRLLRHGIRDLAVRVAEVGDVRAAHGVEVALAVFVVRPPAPPPRSQTAAIPPGESLVTDGIPPIPASIAEAARRYSEFRTAAFWDWHPTRREMLIGTRFGDAQQLHLVKIPGGARTQLTFFPDPVSGASYQPTDGRYVVFSKDVGGGEFFQKYRYDVATGDITLLTDGKSRNVGGVWSHRGDRYAYMSTRRNGRDLDLWVMDPADPRTDRMVLELEGGGYAPLDWSPDDRTMLLHQGISVNESYLWLVDVATGV